MVKVAGGIMMIFLCARLCAQEQLNPFTFKAEYKADIVNNLNGGLQRGSAYVGRMDLTVQLSTGAAGWYNGGAFSVHGINAHGHTPSSSLIGDIQPISRIEASSRTGLFEFWYRHDFKKASAMIGQLDMNALMATNSSSSNFINTSFGMYPSVALNTQLSIYPSATMGIYGEFRYLTGVNIRAAIFDGAPMTHSKNPYNVKWDGNPKAGVFYTTEIEWTRKKHDRLVGSYKVGGFYSSAESPNLVRADAIASSTGGIYASIDQQVSFEESDNVQGLNLFLQVGGSPGDQNFVTLYVCPGLSYKGLIGRRDEDILGVGAVISRVNDSLVEANPAIYESSRILLETHYKMKLGSHFFIQPDVQYIINTGASKSGSNAFVAIVRGALSF